MFKKILVPLFIVACLFSFSNVYAVDSVSTSPASMVTAFGATFVSSPNQTLENTGFSKAVVFLYGVGDNFKIGATLSGIDFNANTLTEADLEQYGAVAIFHSRFKETSRLGWFLKGNLSLATLQGGPFDFSSLIGIGGYWNMPYFDNRFGLVAGIDPVVIDYETKTFGATAYFGVETNLR